MYGALRRGRSASSGVLRSSRSPRSSTVSPSAYLPRTMSSSSSSSSSFPLTSRPANWKSLAPAPLAGGPTFAGQSTLNKLPVPELSETLTKLKDSLKPIAWDEKEYNEVVKKIDEFGKGLGPELQKRLVKRKDETVHWFEQWWDDLAYLTYRDSVCGSPPSSPPMSFSILTLLAS